MISMVRNLGLCCLAVFMGCCGGAKPDSAETPDVVTAQQAVVLPKLSVGIQASPAMTLVMVAEDQGFFDKAGVDVEIQEFTAGKFALQAFLGGSLDLAVSGEVPVTLSTLQGQKFRVIGQVVEQTVNEVRVVARKEGSATDAHSFFSAKKRKLATSFGGGPEFFTYEFLKKHKIDPANVELISQKPEDMPAALANGSADAISIFDPFARIAEVRLGDAAQTFADSDIYSELYVINAMEQTITSKPEALKAFIQGLHDAQAFIQANPDKSKDILIARTKLDRDIVDSIWNNFVFKVAINDRFIQYTSAQAQWAIDKGTFPKDTTIPLFKDVLYLDFLRAVDPSAIQLSE